MEMVASPIAVGSLWDAERSWGGDPAAGRDFVTGSQEEGTGGKDAGSLSKDGRDHKCL